MRQRSTLFLDQFEPLAGTAQKALDEARSQSSEILTNVKAMSDSSRKQLDKVDALLTDVSSSAKTQIARVDESVLANLQKLQETTDVLQRTVLTPVKEIRGVAAAVNAVVNHLAGGRRPRPDQATLDEEMFI